ncbi:MAG: Sua5/YciO/YrdC/YwlC family protein [Planctomycetes bacterium]|nr:Sua5/YciO/YrdC/YwlC family protein [Planctomycetota bacterium]
MPCARRKLTPPDRAELVAAAVRHLRAGELCVLPTETVYGLALLPSNAAALSRARLMKGRAEDHPFTFHLADAAAAEALVGPLSPRVTPLVKRYWPGPLSLVMPGRDGADVGMRVPANEFTRAVIAAAGEPLWLTSVNATGTPPLLDAAAIEAQFGAHLALIVDDGPSPLGSASTVVRLAGQRLQVLREGILSAREVFETAAELVVFVCTGNTCRSPLAEAIARDLTARRLGVAADEVLSCGYAFASAGTSTYDGMPASENSVLAAAEIGLDLGAHQSRQIDHELVRAADHIYCLGESHRRAILAEMPEVASRVHLLRPDGHDIADPYGGELQHYRRARDEIRAAIGQRLPQWLPQ